MSRSIYQSNGEPLSKEALYKQKLKQGVFNSPGAPSVGVNSNASDTAALLAASTDLSVKPSYERTIAPEAQDAALAAKLDKIYLWSRDQVDNDAASAASAGLYGNGSGDKLSTMTSTSSKLGVPPLKNGAIYAAASKNSTSTMTSRINPDKDYRSGLLPKNSASDFNINKISSVANANSTRTMDSRINPNSDVSRSGLKKQESHKSFQANDISGKYLLSAASAKANDRLNSLSAYGNPEDFKAKAQLYANALTIAQKRSDERVAQNKVGLVDLGGGLTVNQAELDKMASLIVQPVLDDINSKAKHQRDTDKAAKEKKNDLIRQHDQAKRDEYKAKQQEKADLEQAKKERIEKNDQEKVGKDKEFEEYQGVENGKVSAKYEEVNEQEKELATKKEELLTKKQENQDEIDAEEQEKISTRKNELEEMQSERDVEIAPLLSELKAETEKLTKLTDAKTELSGEVAGLGKLNEEYLAKVKELEESLAKTETEIEDHTKQLEEFEAKLTETTKEVEDLTKSTDEGIKDVDAQVGTLDTEIEDLTLTKESHLNSKKSQKEDIKTKLAERVKEEQDINGELPEHLKKEVDEKKLLDTSSVFSDEPFKAELAAKEEAKSKAEAEAKSKAEAETKAKATKTTKPLVESPKKEKKSKMKRFTSLFKSNPTAHPPNSSYNRNYKPEEDKSKVKTPAKESSKEPKAVKGTKDADSKSQKTSNSYEGYDDIISEGNNKGGIFKEEI